MAKFGEPTRTGTYKSEDDGGGYNGTTLVYAKLELDYNELRGIERISTNSASTVLPYGLKLGMPIAQVALLLRFVPAGLRANSVAALPLCGDYHDAELRLEFQDGSLKSVQISQYGP